MEHTIDMQNWWDYPTTSGRIVVELRIKKQHLLIKHAVQEGHHVIGIDYRTATGGGGCAPSRKWGEYPTQALGVLEALVHYRPNFTLPAMLKLIDQEIAKFEGTQLTLWS